MHRKWSFKRALKRKQSSIHRSNKAWTCGMSSNHDFRTDRLKLLAIVNGKLFNAFGEIRGQAECAAHFESIAILFIGHLKSFCFLSLQNLVAMRMALSWVFIWIFNDLIWFCDIKLIYLVLLLRFFTDAAYLICDLITSYSKIYRAQRCCCDGGARNK